MGNGGCPGPLGDFGSAGVGEPAADGEAFGVFGGEFDHPQVMGAGAGGVVEFLGIEVAEEQVGGDVIGLAIHDQLGFGGGIDGEPGTIEGEGEVEAGGMGIGAEDEGAFGGGEGIGEGALFQMSSGEVLFGIEEGRVFAEGFLVGADGVFQSSAAMFHEGAGEGDPGGGAITGGGGFGAEVLVAAGGWGCGG